MCMRTHLAGAGDQPRVGRVPLHAVARLGVGRDLARQEALGGVKDANLACMCVCVSVSLYSTGGGAAGDVPPVEGPAQGVDGRGELGQHRGAARLGLGRDVPNPDGLVVRGGGEDVGVRWLELATEDRLGVAPGRAPQRAPLGRREEGHRAAGKGRQDPGLPREAPLAADKGRRAQVARDAHLGCELENN